MAETSGLDERYYTYAKTGVEDILKEFNTSTDGLSDIEAKERVKKYGYNDPVKHNKSSAIVQFLLKITLPGMRNLIQ